MTDPGRLTDSASLARRLLWNRAVDEGPAAPPVVVVLLGPAGSGKTEALESISRDCGSGVVHNSPPLDFSRGELSTVDALAAIAYGLSRKWPSRRSPRFTRFALGLLAVQTDLADQDREQARETLRQEIRSYAKHRPTHRVADELEPYGDVVEPLVDPLWASAVRLLPVLLRSVGYRPLSQAKQWHSDIPEAERADPLDALIQLSARARAEPETMTRWLTSAFLADVRENHPVMAKPEHKSNCGCEKAKGRPHEHNWVVLLDNIDHGGGFQFLDDITAARERQLRQHGNRHDQLLFLATSGRWYPEWESDWHPPWRAAATKPDDVQIVPRCSDAGYWRTREDVSRPSGAYLPVLLEPLRDEETARILGVPVGSRPARLAQRATDGLPRAVQTVSQLLASGNFNTHRRDTLWPANPEQAQSWRDRIDELGLGAHLPDVGIEEFVKAAAWATAPWLVPAESTSLVSQPQVGRILTELRAALWVIAPERRGGTEDHTVLHPWLARNLLGALAARAEEPLYATQFRAMLEDSNVRRDPERHAYCGLALGRFTEVLDMLEDRFDRIPHQDWVDLLTLVTSAPDDKPVSLEHNALYQALVKEDLPGGEEERTPVRNILTRLVAASWLVSNRLAGPDDERKTTVAQSYRELAPLSQRPDVAALYKAARQADALF